MNQNGSSERRRSPRVQGSVPLKVGGEDFDLVSETKNLSSSGVYCRVNRVIDLMSKIRVQFLLPFKQKGKVTTKKLSCDGVVVRVEQDGKQQAFNVAIYFTDISKKDKILLEEYIQSAINEKKEPSDEDQGAIL
ncbi:MAG: PilZ domain-containing protein [Candidatus Omnitrophica bacterium]|nr:PilZ domain-containing protein [Candidatus Omnitrophota bacterium]